MLPSSQAQGPPSPGYYPSSEVAPIGFDQVFKNLWGPQHQSLDQGTLTIRLDNTSGGSGFKSLDSYQSGYFGVEIKLQPNYTAGVITSYYLSNNEVHPEGKHDEIDLEFLGTTLDKPYVLQANVYMIGDGVGNNTGREIRFHLWFDPTQDFHNYAIPWSPSEIMYKNFKIGGCKDGADASCRPPWGSPLGASGLNCQQNTAMEWVQKNYKVYDYCDDSNRDHTLTPEC
ncbi:xyloglucan endotransglucosylase/hydrolase 32 [Actinidia rufa]|uniref:Xyloglucan endotransglucosylase/hydrolase n=1 Tax=Actinidia rufa TaxID=165716 RepID=A0A7J0HBC2_9ERIC|nr:xyloglucan endotransglucosylase/hydrolase 32 [Actinidia rufa]